MNRPLRDLDLCTESLKALEMQINRPRPNRTATRQRDLRPTFACEQRPHNEKGCTHLTDELVWRRYRINLRRIDRQPMIGSRIVRLDAKRLQN